MGFSRRQQNIKIEQSRKKDARWRKQSRRNQKKYHANNREKENAYFKEHYSDNKEYFRQKNKEHYKENGDKWKARRAEIRKEWVFNKCTPSFVESCFASVGASLKTTEDITFAQCCALIQAFGYNLKDVTYPPFINRKRYFDKKRTP